MRSPRALIPLLSVCAAAAIVTAAGTGAAIDGLSGSGPAHADGAARETPEATVTATTWNVCGAPEAGCPLGARPAELAGRIVQQLAGTEVGGRRVKPNAVFLQEVCDGQVQALRKAAQFRGWTWAFAPSASGPACADGQGRPGVAVGTRARLTGVRQTRLASPAGRGRVALCGDVASWSTRVCAAQLSPASEDPRGEWRRKQARALAGAAGAGSRAVIGGDLVDGPASTVLNPLYQGFSECDQGTVPSRTGAGTLQNGRGDTVEKADYLFTSTAVSVSCGVPAAPVRASDHRPLSAVIRFA
ncbi:endonuclease/exonuclease/phosphatase family protein [Actinomadura fibrosa]|uniref:Endonuclease/exonuclease/phosphatase family protein n=1 Tax=Actinomadura fibrosa TaxID=111802 RepID=A0ABW2XE55_9ACTN|nr:endonuclease/exonuclease/phosphatase family protein [Actinomadura fibrosa]